MSSPKIKSDRATTEPAISSRFGEKEPIEIKVVPCFRFLVIMGVTVLVHTNIRSADSIASSRF